MIVCCEKRRQHGERPEEDAATIDDVDVSQALDDVWKVGRVEREVEEGCATDLPAIGERDQL